MNVNSIQPVMPVMPALLFAANARTGEVMRRAQRSFGSTLGAMTGKTGDLADTRKAAEEFVSIAFVEPVLRSLRESNHAPEPFAPTEAEKTFGPLLDAEISKQIVAHERYGLVDAVARQLLNAGVESAGAFREIDTNA